MKNRLYEIIDLANTKGTVSRLYDIIMMVTIIMSLVPLAVKSEDMVYIWIDRAAMVIFIVDYALRWYTADIWMEKGTLSYAVYPFTPMAIIELLSILPSILALGSAARAIRIMRAYGTIRIFRVIKIGRYSKNLMIFRNVLRKQRKAFLVVFLLAVVYVLISALLIFNIEPDTFHTYFDAVYWAIVSLTGMGYGDLYAVTVGGRIITMISALFGIAIVALPSGIITAGYMEEVYKGRLDMMAGQLEDDLELQAEGEEECSGESYEAYEDMKNHRYRKIEYACARPQFRAVHRSLSSKSAGHGHFQDNSSKQKKSSGNSRKKKKH